VVSLFLVYILQRLIDIYLTPIWTRGRP